MSTELEPRLRAWLVAQAPTDVPPDLVDRVTAIPRSARPSFGQRIRGDATTPTRGRSRTMFTATRLIAATAIVALGTGALLFSAGGVPSPTPGPSIVTETVAPGVVRVLGVRETSSPSAPWVFRLDEPGDTAMNHTGIGPDGTVWILETGHLLRLDEPEQWSRDGVGRPDEPDGIPGIRDDIQVAADGTVFTTSWPIRSFDGRGWTTERDGYLFPGQADGAIWAYSEDQIASWEDGRWTEWSVPGVSGGSPYPAAAISDGVIWLGRFDPARAADVGHIWTLARLDGAELTDVTVPGVPDDASPTLIAAGSDGTLWIYHWSRARIGYLARLAGDGWTVFDADDGVPIVRDFYQGLLGLMAVGSDGRIWLTPQDEPQDDCGGIASFDGTEWTAYLPDLCVVDLDVAADGSAWVQTALPQPDGRYAAGPTYRITPER